MSEEIKGLKLKYKTGERLLVYAGIYPKFPKGALVEIIDRDILQAQYLVVPARDADAAEKKQGQAVIESTMGISNPVVNKKHKRKYKQKDTDVEALGKFLPFISDGLSQHGVWVSEENVQRAALVKPNIFKRFFMKILGLL